MRRSAVIICPGRGSYSRSELGYLHRHYPGQVDMLDAIDAARAAWGRQSVRELDAAPRYRPSLHNAGSQSAALTYACALADWHDIDHDRIDVVAVTGNSMGWYLALAVAGATDLRGGLAIADDMGNLMHAKGVGGQIL